MDREMYWSRFADNFDESAMYVVGRDDLEAVLNKVGGQTELRKTLELGCGTGMFSQVLADHAAELLATDFSDEMVAASAERMKSLANVTVEKQDCFALTYGDHEFDTVLMANLLHVIPEPSKAVAEAARVLKPGGRFIVVSYTVEGVSFLNKAGMMYRFLRTWGKPSPHAYTLRLADASRMLTAHGFQIEDSQLIGRKTKSVFITAVRGR